jgi:predicted transcriptional regulator
MMSAKQVVLEILESLPDDCSLEDVAAALDLRHGAAQGARDADRGRLEEHHEVMRQARMYLEW